MHQPGLVVATASAGVGGKPRGRRSFAPHHNHAGYCCGLLLFARKPNACPIPHALKTWPFGARLQTQEEVTRLQQRLLEVQKAGETVATRLTTDALQGSARLQEQNEQLRQELESMEVGGCPTANHWGVRDSDRGPHTRKPQAHHKQLLQTLRDFQALPQYAR